MSTARIPAEQQAALDLAAKGQAGSPMYVAIWLLIALSTDMFDTQPGLAWSGVAILTLLGALRLALGVGVRRLYAVSPARWLKAYALGAIGLGVAWGMLNALLLLRESFAWISVLSSFATAGIVAGGTISLTTHRPLARAYVTAMLLPSALVCLAMGNTQGSVFGLLFLFDIAFLFAINHKAAGEYWSSLRNAELLEQRAEQLELARQRAEAADRAKSRFVATMSHEIRTPLNGVFGMIELLRRDIDHQDRDRYLGLMESSARSLLSVINDILDFSKIEAGMLELERTACRPAGVVDDVFVLFREVAHAKGLGFGVDVGQARDTMVIGDPTRLRQVLSNLVANAVKFTEHGRVDLRLDIQAADEDTVHLRFSIVDTGIGMTTDVAARIFSAFEQADSSTTRRHGGTGLGLAICRQLVELMGGELALESRPGAGSTFSFELALPRAPSTSLPGSRSPEQETRCAGLRVLVVEDNLVNQVVAEETLVLLGCTPTIATTGTQALDHLGAHAYDVVLMDCEMPELDGLETTRRWRERERSAGLPRLPIIALTANASEDDRRRVLAAGMDDFVTKPFAAERLRQALEAAVPGGMHARQQAQASSKPA